jgi:hypothetical protein
MAMAVMMVVSRVTRLAVAQVVEVAVVEVVVVEVVVVEVAVVEVEVEVEVAQATPPLANASARMGSKSVCRKRPCSW